MADILPFKKAKPSANPMGSTLCLQGHHQWLVQTDKKFDVKQGRLVTLLKCGRCGKTKVRAI
jgi:hypothetical protein